MATVGDTLQAQFKTDADAAQFGPIWGTRVTFVQSGFGATSASLNALRGELGQWDFL